MRNSLIITLLALLMTSCYYPHHQHMVGVPGMDGDTLIVDSVWADSLTFEDLHHYDVDYNFILTADSLVLQEMRPMHLLIVPESTDSSVIYKDDHLVVAQIEIIPEDSIDSVWVKVARDQDTQGWVHERDLLQNVVPDDPISQGIHFFSNGHTIFAVAIALLALLTWLARRMRSQRFHLVHLDDIPSPFPMMLCITLAASAVLYASIQHFVPQTWAQFYYHPTLNPFGLPGILCAFLISCWVMVILTVATLDEIRRCLSPTEAVLYTLALVATLALIYIVFSLSTLYYIGYPLLVVYAVLAVWQYLRRNRARYTCGRCGARLHEPGKCPRCGAINE